MGEWLPQGTLGVDVRALSRARHLFFTVMVRSPLVSEPDFLGTSPQASYAGQSQSARASRLPHVAQADVAQITAKVLSLPVRAVAPRVSGHWSSPRGDDSRMPTHRGLLHPLLATPPNTLRCDEQSFTSMALSRAEKALQLDEQRLSTMHAKWKQAVKTSCEAGRELDDMKEQVATIDTLKVRAEKKATAHLAVLADRDRQIKALATRAKTCEDKYNALVEQRHDALERCKARAATDKDANAELVASRDAAISTLRREAAADQAASAAQLAARDATILERDGALRELKMLAHMRERTTAELVARAETQVSQLAARDVTLCERDGELRELRREFAELTVQAEMDAKASSAEVAARDATIAALKQRASSDADAHTALVAACNATIRKGREREATIREYEGTNAELRTSMAKAQATARELLTRAERDATTSVALAAQRAATIKALRADAEKVGAINGALVAARDQTIQGLRASFAELEVTFAKCKATAAKASEEHRVTAAKDAAAGAALVMSRDSTIKELKEELTSGKASSTATLAARDNALIEHRQRILTLQSQIESRAAFVAQLQSELHALQVAAESDAEVRAALAAERDGLGHQIRSMEEEARIETSASAALILARDETIAELASGTALLAAREQVIWERDLEIKELRSSVAEGEAALLELQENAERVAAASAALVAHRESTIEARDQTIKDLQAGTAGGNALLSRLRVELGALRTQEERVSLAYAALLREAEVLKGAAEAAEAAKASLVARARWKLVRDYAVIEALKAKKQRDRAWSRALLAVRDGTISKLLSSGRMCVTISYAVGLRGVRGTPDPYVTLLLGGRLETTPPCKATLEPRFEWTCVFSFESVDVALAETIYVEIFDQAIHVLDNKLGGGSVRLEPFRQALEAGERVDTVVPTISNPLNPFKKKVSAGEVFISLAWEGRHGGAVQR